MWSSFFSLPDFILLSYLNRPFGSWKGSRVIRARFPRDSKIPENYFKIQHGQRGTPEGNKLMLSLLEKSLNLSCRNLDTKKTGLTFFESFVIVIGWERHFSPRIWWIYRSCISPLKGLFINKKTLETPFDFSFDFLDVINLFDYSSFEKSKWVVLRNFF